MSKTNNSSVSDLFDANEVQEVLGKSFYKQESIPAKKRKPKARNQALKADHYDIICISLYKEDLQKLDEKVDELKTQGHRKMSRSALIRYALDQVDTAKLPRSY
ncbi:MAG: hypothetical protein IPJ88_08590 [Myxococcales bacterium]|nr:MAG: hypothetical protein IPJ88_08590 [Myxococcales bacterium]